MKKIGIVTITELENFGNRLQNYALQETLVELGFEVETLRNYIIYKNERTVCWKLKQFIKALLGNKEAHYLLERKKRFDQYDSQYFKFSKYYSTIDFISPNIENQYDYFICGSDQIWNITFPFNLNFNFLTFAPYEKRISYAGSFGISSLPNNFSKANRDSLSKKVQGLKGISVREYQGADIIRELCGIEASVLVDPTLLLDIKYWNSMATKPKQVNENCKFILKYFLGNDEMVTDQIQSYANKNDYQLIDLYDRKTSMFSINPAEFLWLVKHAELMITDSFHGTVFSILFNTPFISQNRTDSQAPMNSRLETLFKKIGVNPINSLDRIEECRPFNNYEQDIIHTNLNKEKIISINYLKKNLDLL